MSNSLRIAFVHPEVRYRQPEVNRDNLLRLNREAARHGADIILNTELPVTGYSFDSRNDISDCVEPDNGRTMMQLAGIAREHRKYIGIGLAECDETTGIYYNSAIVIAPNGRIVCKYRKINAEMRWACPGGPNQQNTFDTPWGRVGVLICSDSYYGLFPRSMALKGVDLLWVPANWPPGGLDPREVWRARVLENGFFLAACGRTGKDRIMDCRDAVSCAYNPRGQELFAASSRESRVFFLELPLDNEGKLQTSLRTERLKSRDPSTYRPIYLDLRLVDDLTAHYELPKPGRLPVHCIVPGEKPLRLDSLEEKIRELKGKGPCLFVLSPFPAASVDRTRLHSLAKRNDIALCATLLREKTGKSHILLTPDGEYGWREGAELPFPMVHYGSAKVGMAPFDSFVHPELAVTFSKLGCDLVVLSEEKLETDSRLLCGIKSVENIAVAVCASNGALICMAPRGHERWEERSIEGPGICSCELDTLRTRKKRFQDRVNFELLLKYKAKNRTR